MINYLKKSDMRKIELAIAVNVISSKDNDEECVMLHIVCNAAFMAMQKKLSNHFFLGIKLDW